MGILIICDINSYLVRQLVAEYYREHPDFSIDILDVFRGVLLKGHELAVFPLQPGPRPGFAKKRAILKGLWRSAVYMLSARKYDHIHLFYLAPAYRLVFRLIRMKSRALVITLFGSDFYLISRFQQKMGGPFLRNARWITFSNEGMAADFIAVHGALKEKVRVCRFGLSLTPHIERWIGMPEKAKATLGLPAGKIVVCCGHSASRRERHDLIISQLAGLPGEIKSLLFCVFPFTYNADFALINEVELAMKTTGIPFLILARSLTDDEVAALRVATDVMISIPSSDQMTASMLETLYAGGHVITGQWLPYDLLDRSKVIYSRIPSPGDLGSCLVDLLAGHDRQGFLTPDHHNRQVIGSLFAWNSTVGDWLDLYRS